MINEIKEMINKNKEVRLNNIKKELEEMERKHSDCMDRLDIEMTMQSNKINETSKGLVVGDGQGEEVLKLGHGNLIVSGNIDLSNFKLTQSDIQQELHRKIHNVSQAMDKALEDGDISTYHKLTDVYSKLLSDAGLKTVQQPRNQ